MHPECRKQLDEVLGEEIVVFEDTEDGQVDNHIAKTDVFRMAVFPALLEAVDIDAGDETAEAGKGYEKQEPPIP